MGKKKKKERNKGRERGKKGIRSTQLVPVQRDFFSRVSSCGERTVMKRRIIQAWYYLSKLFLQAVCRRTAGIPPWNWKEDYTYRRRSGKKKKGRKKIKRKKLRVKSRWKRLTFPSYLKLTCKITRNYRPFLFFSFFFFSYFTNTDYNLGLQLLFIRPRSLKVNYNNWITRNK